VPGIVKIAPALLIVTADMYRDDGSHAGRNHEAPLFSPVVMTLDFVIIYLGVLFSDVLQRRWRWEWHRQCGVCAGDWVWLYAGTPIDYSIRSCSSAPRRSARSAAAVSGQLFNRPETGTHADKFNK